MKDQFLRRLGALLLALALVVPMAVTPAWAAEGDPDPTFDFSVLLDRPNVELTVGGKEITVTAIAPENDGYTLSYSWDCADGDLSSHTEITTAVVDNTITIRGLAVTAAPIKIMVTATWRNLTDLSNTVSQIAFCSVTVTEPVTGVTLDRTALSLNVGVEQALTATVVPANAGNKTVTWESSDPSVATVDGNGLVTAVAAGDATITVTTVDGGKTASCAVTVKTVPVAGVTLNKGTLSLEQGLAEQLTATIAPGGATNKTVTWKSSDPRVATVDENGLVTAVGPGSAKITVTTEDGGKTANCDITVTPPQYRITFNITETSDVQEGEDGQPMVQFNGLDRVKQAFAIVDVPDGFNYSIDWVLSDPATELVRMTEQGHGIQLALPTARKAGEVFVTARLMKGNTKDPVLNGEGRPVQAELKVIVSGVALGRTSLELMEGMAWNLGTPERYGEARNLSLSNLRWNSTDPSIVSVDNGALSAWSQGTSTITVTLGEYTASCVVKVIEDEGTYVNVGSTSAGTPISMTNGTVVSQLNRIAQERTETHANMTYVTGLFVSPAQGIVHNTHRSDDDTGAGVSMGEQYTVSGSGPQSLSALSFVPNRNFTGTARISYTGWADGQLINGAFLVEVGPMSDVTYSTGGGAPATFRAEDFNTVSRSRTGSNIQYATFTPPSPLVGTLYYNYTSATHPGQVVASSTQFRRTGTPGLDDVVFVPAEGFSGTVRIPYRAVTAANATFSGTVIIHVAGQSIGADDANVNFSAEKGEQLTFKSSDFATACWNSIGETLSHVRFTPPERSAGTLFYNYRSFSSYDSMVSAGTNYYRTGAPNLDGVSFVPLSTTPSRVAIPYTGYGISGRAFTGTVYIDYDQLAETGIRYSIYSGDMFSFLAEDFNRSCVTATNSTLESVVFENLPSDLQGVLYHNYFSSDRVPAYIGNTYYRTGSTSQDLIGRLTFLADSNFSGILRIPFTGYSVAGNTFRSEVVIQVDVPSSRFAYTATAASPIQLSAARFRAACSERLRGEVAYITFPDLPDPDSGRLYLNYNGFGTGSPVTSTTQYFLTGNPSVDRISFVPRGRFEGEAAVTYIAWSRTGEQVTGQITFNIVRPTASHFFTDMGNHLWAAAAVDYLYQNNVTNGVTQTTYGPNQQILRRDFVVLLHRALGFPNTSGSSFADVPANEYYSQAIATAKRLGIVSGDGANFRPDSPITRQDAMVIIKNAMSAAGRDMGSASTGILGRFPDGIEVSGYAREAVSLLVQLGAVRGDDKGLLNPSAPITRAEAAVILHFVLTM